MRAPQITLREDAAHDRTIDALLEFGWFNQWQRPLYAAIADTSVSIRNDPRPAVRMGAMVPTMYSSSRHEARYGQTQCELRGMLLGLETAGFTPRAIAVGDAPDGLVTLDSGSIWVEHAEIVDPASARYTNMMSSLDRDVKDEVDADATAFAQLSGHHLEIRFGACPTKGHIREVRDAVVNMIRNGDHVVIPEMTFTKLTTPEILKAFDTSVTRAAWRFSEGDGSPFILQLQAGAYSFDPLSLAPIALRRLEVKQKLAPRYGVSPLWLVMTVTDLRGVWDESMAYLGSGCPSIAPYDRVIVCDPGRAIIWANGVMALRDVRQQSCRTAG